MKQLQELRNEILTFRNYGVINKEEEKSLLTKLNSVKEQFAICGVVKSLPSENDIRHYADMNIIGCTREELTWQKRIDDFTDGANFIKKQLDN